MKKICFLVLLMLMSFENVKALEDYYINEKGVKISKNFVSMVSDYIDPDYFNLVEQKEYDFYVDLYSDNYESEVQYHVTKNLVQNGKVLATENIVMNEDEYNEYSSSNIDPLVACDPEDADACWETSSKRITLTTSNSNACSASAFVQWLTTPNVRSYDVLAIMWEGNAKYLSSFAQQFYKNSSGNLNKISYDTENGDNTKRFSNGIGVSMNLVNNNVSYSLSLGVALECNSGMTFRASYQHAKSVVSLAESKSYTLNTSGLGGVIKFNSTAISNKYDGMQGLKYYAPKI